MVDLGPFPDIADTVCDLLADLGTTDTVAPGDLEQRLPFIRVTRYGGADNLITDTARIDVDVWQSTYAESWALAEAVRQRLLSGPHVVGGVTLDRASTDTAPNEVPWVESQTFRRFTAAYSITARRPRSS